MVACKIGFPFELSISGLAPYQKKLGARIRSSVGDAFENRFGSRMMLGTRENLRLVL